MCGTAFYAIIHVFHMVPPIYILLYYISELILVVSAGNIFYNSYEEIFRNEIHVLFKMLSHPTTNVDHQIRQSS